jgi:formylglycine-generating enzyme required for sulfatase activity
MNEEQQKRITQLQAALAAGLIDQDTYDTAVAAMQARLTGGGAIAQGANTQAVGAGGVLIAGDSSGFVNLGVYIQQAARPGADAATLRRAYLARLLQQANQLPLFGGDSARAEIRLSSVYTALLTQAAEHSPERDLPGREREPRHLSALNVLNAESKLVLLGGPGSGKTTFVQFVALCLAGEALGVEAVNLQTLTAPIPPEPDAEQQEPRPQHWDHGPLLPVPVVLRDFAIELLLMNAEANAEALWRHIEGRLQPAALADFAPYLRDELMGRGGLILLDGLEGQDEEPIPELLRGLIIGIVRDFSATFSRCRFIVTSRANAYSRQDWKLSGFTEASLLPFTAGQVRRFITAWYGHMADLGKLSDGKSRDRAEVLRHAIARSKRLAELVEQPVLLALITHLNSDQVDSSLRGCETLYREAGELLLEDWENLKAGRTPDASKSIALTLDRFFRTKPEDIPHELRKLAREAHRNQAELEGEPEVRKEWLEADLPNTLPIWGSPLLGLMSKHLRDQIGPTTVGDDKPYQFPHPQTLAVLLCADSLHRQKDALLAIARIRRDSLESLWNLIQILCCNEPPQHGLAPGLGETLQPLEADLWGALLATQILCELGVHKASQLEPIHQAKQERAHRWMQAIIEQGWLPPVDRAIAGQMLSIFGDGRDFDRLIAIPAGDFWMGDKNGEGGTPRHQISLLAFEIGQFPVTNSQYWRFIQATGRPWTSPAAGKLSLRNHPAINVTWHDALDYCRWLTKQWRKTGRIRPDQAFTLPIEAEWERAAAGPEGWLYPWGNEWRESYANTQELGLSSTSAVGLFPLGGSESGCLDMAGNVWEWTLSGWNDVGQEADFSNPHGMGDRKEEDLSMGNNIQRVVRGGCWYSFKTSARSSARDQNPANYLSHGIGFRVALVSAPVS